ncbi:MAG: choice-of-anchor B family protein [Actinomycetota bacterium]
MGSRASRISRRSLAVGTALGLVLTVVGATGAAAHGHPGHPELTVAKTGAAQSHPDHEFQEGAELGVRVNSPENLVGFHPGVQWGDTGPVDNQTADLVYAGTGCTPASYAEVAGEIQGNIALVDDRVSETNPNDQCPTYTFFQKVRSAQTMGAIAFVQIPREGDEPTSNATAIAADIPALELERTEAILEVRDAVIADTTVNVTLPPLALLEAMSDLPCVDGMAGPFPCDGIDLLAFVPQEEFDGAGVSDIWGWTDPETGDEYVFFGKTNGTAFFRVTDPTNPVYLGELPNPALVQRIWHDMKVFDNHAFIVSESEPHGMSVFDLTRLRGVTEPQTFDRDAWYPLHSAAHNIAINEDTGFAYIVGGNAGILVPDLCLSGLHMVDISTPTQPTFAGCYLVDGGPGTLARSVGGPVEENSPAAYVHDAHCVIYEGPDERYVGREICFNASEDQVTIADVTNKPLPSTISVLEYPNVSYSHQGWLSEDHRFLFVNDELDEVTHGINTRTIVLDVTDLENPAVHFEHLHDTISIDHNNYVHQGLLYQSNYTSGLRVLDTAFVGDPDNPRLEPAAFFDTFPAHSDPVFAGTWSNYPFFESGTIAVSGIDEGLFLLRLSDGDGDASVVVTCANCPVQIQAGGGGVARVIVGNTGTTDDTYKLAVGDLPEGWTATIRPEVLAVGAGDEGLARVRVKVPRGTAAGTYTLILTATSTTDPSVSASGEVEVLVKEKRR